MNFQNLDTLRQRNIRQARNGNYIVTRESEIGPFIEFYTKLMQAQGEDIGEGGT